MNEPHTPRPYARENERVAILGELHGEIMVFQPLTIREISQGGAQIETAFPLQLDSLHDLRLTLGGQSVVVKGRIAHCSIADVDQETVTYRSGIEFVELPDHATEVIADFLHVVRESRERP